METPHSLLNNNIPSLKIHQNPSGSSGCMSCEWTEVTKVAAFSFSLGIVLRRRLSTCRPATAVAYRHRTDSSPSESLSPGLKPALHFTFPVQSRCPSSDVHTALHADSRRRRTDILAGTWRALHQPCVYFPCGQIPPSIIIAFYRRLILRHAHD